MSERVESLLEEMLEQQRLTNQLLAQLIEAMAVEGETDEREPATYLDGSQVL